MKTLKKYPIINKIWHPTAVFALLFALTSILVAIPFSKSFGQAEGPIIVPTGQNGSLYCPFTELIFTTTATVNAPKSGRVEYQWSFQNGSPSTYLGVTYGASVSPSPGNTSKNPTAVLWTEEGTFTITLTIQTFTSAAGGSPSSTVVYATNITVSATCCQQELIDADRDINPAITGLPISGVYTGIWYISGDVTISNPVDFTGLLLVEGDASPNVGPGGTVAGSTISLDGGVEFSLTGGEIRAACDEMWGGIEAGEDAVVVFSDGALMKDSWDCIHPNTSNSSPYYFNIQNSEFFNNRMAVQGEDVDLSTAKYFVVSNTFDANTETMLSPYEYDQGHNEDHAFTMEVGLNIFGASDMSDVDYWRGNTFSNALVGVNFKPDGNNVQSITSLNNDYYNNLLAGIYAEDANIVRFFEISEFQVPTEYPPSVSYYGVQIPDFQAGGNAIDIPINTAVGIANSDVNDLDLSDARIFQDASNPDFTFTYFLNRTGIFAESVNDVDISNTEISNMNRGINTSNVDDLILEENLSVDNEYHYYIKTASPASTGIAMTCNSTKITSAVSSVQTYGLYVPFGSTINGDIGGDNSSPTFTLPAGNGWPVDPASTGYNANPPSTFGGGTVQVSNWDTPNNWTAISDLNTIPGWKYWRYDNEYVGEHDGGTDPPSIVDNPNTNPQTTILSSACPVGLNIVFPQFIVLQYIEESNIAALAVYPNPVNTGNEITLKGAKQDEVSQVLVIDMNGRGKIVNWTKSSEGIHFALPENRAGEYLVKVNMVSGSYEIARLIIQ